MKQVILREEIIRALPKSWFSQNYSLIKDVERSVGLITFLTSG